MNRSVSRSLRTAIGVGATAIFLAAAGVQAQTVHRHVDAEGRTTFSDQAMEAAAPVARPGSRFLSHRRSAEINANEATLRLVRAQIALSRAADAAPAQHDEDGAGKARNLQRQAALQRVVDQAQERVDETNGAGPQARNVR